MPPIPLNDPRWSEFLGGYRTHEDFPSLLGDLQNASLSELWDSLHHQGDVDHGSYAALPYLLDFAQGSYGSENIGFLGLAATIFALSTAKHNPTPPGDIAEQMRVDRVRLGQLALAALADLPEGQADEEALTTLLGAVSIAKGQIRLGNTFLEWQAEYYCPECDALITPTGYDL